MGMHYAAGQDALPLHERADVAVLGGALPLRGGLWAVRIRNRGRGRAGFILCRQGGVCCRVPPAARCRPLTPR